MKMFEFLITPGHGYLKVDIADLKQAVKKGAKFSRFSSRKGFVAYLEEDCDANEFMRVMGLTGKDLIYTNGDFDHNEWPSI